MLTSTRQQKIIYLIIDNESTDIVVSYKTPAYNTSKAIYTRRSSCAEAVKYLNECEGRERYRIYGFAL